MFLCRETELQKLNRRFNKSQMECVILYGRRRVGKTALINEFVKDKPVIYFPALNTNAKDNLTALSKAICAYLYPDTGTAPVYGSFDDAFAEITRITQTKRAVFVIDEFPYLAKADSSIPSRLQHLLDHDWKDSKLFLILCGSSMSFMEKEVLSSKSPLFGRRTAQFRLKPLTYLDAAKFHPELPPETNALIYGITGGIPHYINKLAVKSNLKEALLENFFDTSAYLFEEPENLLKQELREPAIYNSIIAAIANGAARLNEISQRTGLETAKCAKYIYVLTELGIIQKIKPITEKAERKTLYKIADPFFRFWYRFVPGNMMNISAGTIARNYDAAIGSYLSAYMDPVFEEICRQYLIYYADNLPFAINEIGEWWGPDPSQKKEARLDIVALASKENNTQAGRRFIIGSCKYKNEKTDTDELYLMQRYASLFTNTNDECFYYIFSKSGFTDALLEKQEKGEVRLITLGEMY
ncbi:MAG: ATP-binding protein [Acidaminococcaceae bacterium]|nr:ATP-binding protein [Acidaminococcaceae bacterium]